MVAGNWITIDFDGGDFTYAEACRVARKVMSCETVPVLLRLDSAASTSTAAMARLVLLRRNLLAQGRDIKLAGLAGRVKAVYEIARMHNLLPLRQLNTGDESYSVADQRDAITTGRFATASMPGAYRGAL